MSMNTVKNAVDKIEEFQKFGSILGLERMTRLMEELGNPQDELKVIHVAGTNGKGSISRYMYSILEELGYKCGLYTSPFLEVFNERIEFDRKYISDEELETYTNLVLEKTNKIIENGEDSPTEFEIITAIAFLYFKEKKSDFVVLEVGLGGIGDSTNIIKKPLVSVIASISYDHMDRLGNTIEEIAKEKAGIIKSNCPVVCSTDNENALKVIRNVAKSKNAPLTETKNFKYEIKSQGLEGYVYDFNGEVKDFKSEDMCNGFLDESDSLKNVVSQALEVKNLEISMYGRHQIQNSICAATAIKLMANRGILDFDENSFLSGMKKAKQIGRLEVFSSYKTGEETEGLIILDGAHNIDGAAKLREAMEELSVNKKVLIVTAMLADKDVDGILNQFQHITKDFIVTEPKNPRRAEANILEEKLTAYGCDVIREADYIKAVKIALVRKASYDIVLFAGSLYLIGAVRALLKE